MVRDGSGERNRVHALTIDLEEYFQVSGFDDAVSPDRWPGLPSRIEATIARARASSAGSSIHTSGIAMSGGTSPTMLDTWVLNT